MRNQLSPTLRDIKQDPVATASGSDRSWGGPVATAPGSDMARSLLLIFVRLFAFTFFFCLLLFTPTQAVSQAGPQEATGILQLKVKPKINGKDRELARKRFYLIKGNLEDNKELVEKIGQQTIITRECFYRNARASEAFINWLKQGDCESVYCRPIEEKFLTGPEAVPEFQAAYERSMKEYKVPGLGRAWLTTNLTNEIRDGFYRQKQVAIKALINEAATHTKAAVASVMTDRKGTAYFTDVAPGTYLVTNLVPTELGDSSVLWMCEVKIGEGKKRLQIPNIKDKNVKCVVVEKPLPACDPARQSASTR